MPLAIPLIFLGDLHSSRSTKYRLLEEHDQVSQLSNINKTIIIIWDSVSLQCNQALPQEYDGNSWNIDSHGPGAL